MTNYDTICRALRNGTARQAIPRWTSRLLEEIAHNRTNITGVRHPLGFLCLPLERIGGTGICVHVWSDSLPRADLTTSEIHAHSWDLTSHVLYGSVRNGVFDVIDAPRDAAYRIFEVHSSADIDELRETPRLVCSKMRTVEVSHQGDSYSVAAGVFHTTTVKGEAATVALGSSRPGTVDRCLGGIDARTHRIRRQLCGRDETARTARVVREQLLGTPTMDQENRWEP